MLFLSRSFQAAIQLILSISKKKFQLTYLSILSKVLSLSTFPIPLWRNICTRILMVNKPWVSDLPVSFLLLIGCKGYFFNWNYISVQSFHHSILAFICIRIFPVPDNLTVKSDSTIWDDHALSSLTVYFILYNVLNKFTTTFFSWKPSKKIIYNIKIEKANKFHLALHLHDLVF